MQSHYSISFAKPKFLAIACLGLMCLFIGSSTVVAQQLPGVKCVVDGNQQCQIEHVVVLTWGQGRQSEGKQNERYQGKIFFSSKDAADQFQTRVVNKLKFDQRPDSSLLLKANHQLALTGQVKQQLCPVTEKSIAQEHQLLVGGVSVYFHDAAAKSEVESGESTWHRAERVFASGVFAKSFVKRAEPVKQVGVTVADGSANSIVDSEGEAATLPAKR